MWCIYLCVCMFMNNMYVYRALHGVSGAWKFSKGVFWISLCLLRQGSWWIWSSTFLASLASQLTSGIPGCCLPCAGVTGGHRVCPAFIWVLEIWTLLLKLAWQTLYPWVIFPVQQHIIFKLDFIYYCSVCFNVFVWVHVPRQACRYQRISVWRQFSPTLSRVLGIELRLSGLHLFRQQTHLPTEPFADPNNNTLLNEQC